ncbi:sce7726 family protein [Phenylobacterium sp. RIFCSPHIGHO2_01_FULL_69_31]|uniref:sce7726 family protein n=1 Tax=Phenylobacterium sp. RIFCSPHIGHO2_01_FULL_69_31 TaxID=1801944 RepID=UPI0025FD3D72|nr:sce7726 family protein [Phenylobacterium sp. RIFCSPHIGHO2_01_FULL_69_31]
MVHTPSQLAALSRLFSATVFREMATKGRSATFARLIGETGLLDGRFTGPTVAEAFDAAFSRLRRAGARDEYVYRSALTHNVLLGKHSLNTAAMLAEFRAGACKADLVILNGTATVYEIKSERDSLVRLENQIRQYRRVFAKAYVIAGEDHVSDVLKATPAEVGVLSLVRWDRINTVREAVETFDAVCPVAIFEALRTAEACKILTALGGEPPDVPNTELHRALRTKFEQLDAAAVHREMVSVLKQTRNLAPLHALVDRLPASLQPAALSIQVRRADHERLVKAVSTPFEEALTWG